MTLVLYSGPISMFGSKAEIALREKGVPFDLQMVPFTLEAGYEPKHPDVLRHNPFKQQVPVLVDGDVVVYDSTQIFEYLEDRCPQPPLWPQSVSGRALARRLELESDEVMFPQVVTLIKERRGGADPQAAAQARLALQAHMQRLDVWLQGREWLAHSYSYADIATFMCISFAAIFNVRVAPQQERLMGWLRAMRQRGSTQPIVQRLSRGLEEERALRADSRRADSP